VNSAILSKGFDGLAVQRIEGDKPAIKSSNKDPFSLSLLPESGTAIDEEIIWSVPIQLRIERPKRLSRFRIECNNTGEGRCKIHHAIHHQGGAFECREEVIGCTIADV